MRFIIMAANGREQEFRDWLGAHGFSYAPMIGCYKGEREPSFKIKLNIESIDFALLTRKAVEYAQESILTLDSKNKAELIYMSDLKRLPIGTFHRVPKSVADTKEAWTFDATSNSYYVAA